MLFIVVSTRNNEGFITFFLSENNVKSGFDIYWWYYKEEVKRYGGTKNPHPVEVL